MVPACWAATATPVLSLFDATGSIGAGRRMDRNFFCSLRRKRCGGSGGLFDIGAGGASDCA